MKKLLALALVTNALIADTHLDGVVVTTKSQCLAIDTAGSFSVVTQKDIKKMNATSIQEVLEEIVGISVGINRSSIGGRKSISIRGADSKHSLILIDGKKVSGSDAQIGHSDFQYNWLPLNAIQKIEVIRGPMSSLYGSSSIGGVVNIITKRPEDTLSGEISLKYGLSSDDGGDEFESSFLLGGKINDKLSASMFVQYENIELTKNATNQIFTADREGKEITNSMLNLWYDIDDTQQLSFSGIFGKETREFIQRVPGKTINYDEYYDIDKRHYSFGYSKTFDEFSLDLKYYTTESESHTAEFLKTHKLDSDVINAEVMYTELEDHFIVAGVEKKVDKYTQDNDDKTKVDFSDEIDYFSGFVQDEVSLGEKTILTLGLRYDKHERFGSEWSPKVGAVYKLNRHHRIKAAYGHGFNAPTVSQNSSKYKFYGPHNFFGNDNLKPETSDSYELGYEFTHGSREFRITAYETNIDDLIHFIPIDRDGDKITYLYSNIKSAKLQGIELEIVKRHLFNLVDVNFGYNYLKTEDQNGNDIVGKPEHKANLSLNGKLYYDIDGTFRIRYIGTQVDEVDNQFVELSSYTLMALQFSKNFNKFTTKFGVENLMDKKLSDEHLFHNKGRLIYFGINYKF